MGKLFNGTNKTTQKSDPWAPQADQLKNAMTSAGDIYNQQKATPFFEGDLYAGMGDMTRQGVNSIGQFAGSNNTGQTISNAANPLLAGGQMSMNSMNDLYGMTQQDATADNIRVAQAYANDPALQGTIDAANRDTARNLYEGDLPEINRNASASGNMNSSRAGMADAIARRGADDRMADTSAVIRSDAYNRGLGMAENQRSNNMTTLGNLTAMGQNGLGLGMEGMLSGDRATMDNYNAMISAGMIDQQDRQGQLDANYAKWQGNDTRQNDLLSRYYNVIGANNWGGTQTTDQKTGGNIFGKIAGAAATAASFASDIRLKTNIKHIGETEDGLGVYEYDYLPIEGEIANYMPEGRQRGVMAHEVAELRPDALGPTIDGYMTVNYGAL